MGLSDWTEIYRAYSGAELDEEMASLRKSLKGGFLSQGSGSVQHAKDLVELRDRLRAATRVKAERSGRGNGMQFGTVDFSRSRSEDF